jgi:hypothetical protein
VEKTNKEELYDLCSLPNIVRVMKSRTLVWSRYVVHMGGRRGAYRVLVGRPHEQRLPERPRHR